jgi:hypothetical protein
LIARWQQGTYLISVRKIACQDDEIEEEVVIDVGPEMVGGRNIAHSHSTDAYRSDSNTTKVKAYLRPHVCLVISQPYLYAIPPMASVLDDQAPRIVQVTAVAVYGPEEPVEIWNSICAHHKGRRVATAADAGVQDYALIVWPSKRQSEDNFIRHSAGHYTLVYAVFSGRRNCVT